MPGKRSVVFNVVVKEVYFRRIPSYDRFPSDGVECPLGMELKHCDEAEVPIRSKSPTTLRRLRRLPRAGRQQRRKLLGLTPRPEQTQHSKKGEENTGVEKSSRKVQLLQKGGGEGGTEGGLEKKKGEQKLKRKREEENGGEERERELKRKREEEYESQPQEGEKEEEEPKREREEKANDTEMPETSEGGGEEPKREEKEKKDNQAHLLEKTEEDNEEDGEEELRAILASRQWSGCSCKDQCREETCECLQAGIHCRHTGFPGGRSSCACSSRHCNNTDPRLRGSWRRKQNHFTQVMTRVLLEESFGDEDEEEEGASSTHRAS